MLSSRRQTASWQRDQQQASPREGQYSSMPDGDSALRLAR